MSFPGLLINMTQQRKGKKLESVAIISGGPGGLAALHELFNVSGDCSTLVNKPEPLKTHRFFKNLVLFERANDIGGVWRFTESPGTSFSQFLSLSKVNDMSYNRPDIISSSPDVPPNVDKYSYESPLVYETSSNNEFPPPLEYYDTALYRDLYTNTPDVLMRFSFQPRISCTNTPYSPLIGHSQVKANLDAVAQLPGMKKLIRYNSSVQRVRKIDGQWHVTVREGAKKWYVQTFDAVVIASGRQYYPYWPQVDGMSEVKSFVSYSKNFRSARDFADKVCAKLICTLFLISYPKSDKNEN